MPTDDQKLLEVAARYLGHQLAIAYLAQSPGPYRIVWPAEPQAVLPRQALLKTAISRRHAVAMGITGVFGAFFGNRLVAPTREGSVLDIPNDVLGTVIGGGAGVAGGGVVIKAHRRRIIDRLIENSFLVSLDLAEEAAAESPQSELNAEMTEYLEDWSSLVAPELLKLAASHRESRSFVSDEDGSVASVERRAQIVSELVVTRAAYLQHGADHGL